MATVVWANCVKVSLCFQNCLKVRDVHKLNPDMRGILGLLRKQLLKGLCKWLILFFRIAIILAL